MTSNDLKTILDALLKLMVDETTFKKVSVENAFYCTFLFLLTTFILSCLTGIIVFFIYFPIPIIIGIISFLLCIYLNAKLAGKILYHYGLNSSQTWWTGIFLIWGSVVTSTIIGTFCFFLIYYFYLKSNSISFRDMFYFLVASPVFLIGFFSFVPSLLFGLLWAKMTKKQLNSLH